MAKAKKAKTKVSVRTRRPKRHRFMKSQLNMFWYWMRERHSIYLKRFIYKEPWPWTNDEILQEYKFTNVYRQLDRVTLEWCDRYINLISKAGGVKRLLPSEVLFHNVMFRLFNLPETYDALYFGMQKWDLKKAVALLTKRQKEDHEQIFTGAYIVSNGNSDAPKVEVICGAVDYLHRRKIRMANAIRRGRRIPGTNQYEGPTMEYAVEVLQRIPTVGQFVAYEIACDLRFTKVLGRARDVLSWANPGPGAKRGLHRLLTGSKEWNGPRPDYIDLMRGLLAIMPNDLRKHLDMTSKGVPLELREIEHSLCEFDKYMRVKGGEGKPRSRYHPPRGDQLPLFGDEG
jgi:hypothetical protein